MSFLNISLSKRFGAGLAALILANQPVLAGPEDIMAGAFDQVTGVPVMTIMLGIIRSQESLPTTPENLDRRLQAVEAQLVQLDTRLKLVETKVDQLQQDVVRLSNISRLRELQGIRSAIDLINKELMTHPTSVTQVAILEFRAQQQADLLRDNVAFDIWQFSDIDGSGNLRTRFRPGPAFELYVLALTTWLSALEGRSQTTPQAVVRDYGAALKAHAAFLQTRISVPPPNGPPWTELRTDRDATPVTLPEHLRTSVFCRLEGGDTFANRDGDCTFGQVCYDNIEDTKTLTGQTILRIPAGNGALCTWNPDQPRLFAGEEEFRNQHGLEVMSTLAEYLARMAVTGSLKGQLIGVFPNSVSSAIFSVELSRPMVASIVSTAGVAPSIARCGVRGCLLGPETHQYHWIFDQTNHLIYHFGSRLCLDVKDNAASPGASVVLWTCNGTPTQKWDKGRLPPYTLVNTASNLCVTVASLTGNPRFVDPTAARSLSLQPCDGRGLQKFSNDDGTIVGPR